MSEIPSIYSYHPSYLLHHWIDTVVWDPVATCTLVLAVSTIGLWIATRKLWLGAEAQAEDVRRNSLAAERAAIAAERSAQILVSQLRAWVQVHSSSISDIAAAGPVEVAIEISNEGQTPALDVVHWQAYGVLPWPNSNTRPEPPEDLSLGKSTMPPGGHSTAYLRRSVLSINERQGLANGTMVFSIWGKITYRDVFGQKHTTLYKREVGGAHGLNGNALAHSAEGEFAD